jgi:N6-adenosine-specific RNA methylase IME4
VKYHTILADPPWIYADPHVSYPGAPGRQRRITKPLPYEQMTIEQIAAVPVADLADRDACLWLWTTNRYLCDAFKIVAAWGFEFRQVIVWRKTGSPSPFRASIAPNHAEFLLHGRRGKPVMLGTLPSNVIDAPKQYAHSRKPEVFIDLIEQVSPGPYLEMFARRHRLGWSVWGNESANTATLDVGVSA